MLSESGPRVPPSVRTQSDEFYAAVFRAEQAANPKPPKLDNRRELVNPFNGNRRPNPNFGKEMR